VLPLVPVDSVEDLWFNALEENEDMSPEVTRFTDYVTESWVEGQQLDLWNHYNNDGPRTTNTVEGWHSKVKKLCKSAHPNVYTFVNMFQSIQAANEAKIIQLEAGGKPPAKRRKYVRINIQLRQLKERFHNNEIDLIHYADAASHLLHLE